MGSWGTPWEFQIVSVIKSPSSSPTTDAATGALLAPSGNSVGLVTSAPFLPMSSILRWPPLTHSRLPHNPAPRSNETLSDPPIDCKTTPCHPRDPLYISLPLPMPLLSHFWLHWPTQQLSIDASKGTEMVYSGVTPADALSVAPQPTTSYFGALSWTLEQPSLTHYSVAPLSITVNSRNRLGLWNDPR